MAPTMRIKLLTDLTIPRAQPIIHPYGFDTLKSQRTTVKMAQARGPRKIYSYDRMRQQIRRLSRQRRSRRLPLFLVILLPQKSASRPCLDCRIFFGFCCILPCERVPSVLPCCKSARYARGAQTDDGLTIAPLHCFRWALSAFQLQAYADRSLAFWTGVISPPHLKHAAGLQPAELFAPAAPPPNRKG